jgi:hypothetical protein
MDKVLLAIALISTLSTPAMAALTKAQGGLDTRHIQSIHQHQERWSKRQTGCAAATSTTPTGRRATTRLLMAPTAASRERQLAVAHRATLQALTLLRWVPGFV